MILRQYNHLQLYDFDPPEPQEPLRTLPDSSILLIAALLVQFHSLEPKLCTILCLFSPSPPNGLHRP